MNKQIAPIVACFVIVLLIGALMWRISHIGGLLRTEIANHRLTANKLGQAVEDGQGWKAAFEKARDTAEAHKDATAACMERERQASQDRKDREALLQAAKPRPRTEQEQQQVIDDETRQRAADRLNRSL